MRTPARYWIVLAAFGCLGADVAAQSANGGKPTPITDAANRIAKNLWSTQGDPAVPPNTPVFRSGVTLEFRPLPPPWHLTETPGPTNPRFNGYHQEHLMMTTPEAFRTSTFYPIGIGVDPAVIVNAAKGAWRDWKMAKIRRRIAGELEALERGRTSSQP